VAALQTPADAINGMHSLLAAAEVAPPYVLLGASFGGLLSYLYANTYPEDVVGMVLLDAMFPDEMSLEHLFPKPDRYKAFDKEDEDITLESQPLQGATRS
jgi:pimeloyl-ACP methyl ester carboxylesterase